MSGDRIYIEGELYLSLETVAAIYRVDVLWLREVVEADLLGDSVVRVPRTCIAAIRLDRVATIVHFHEVLGLDIASIGIVLGPDSRG
jgi:hypothetical protein